MNDTLIDGQLLFVSFEGNVFKISTTDTTEEHYLRNNHVESDTRIFFLITNINVITPIWVVWSTDTDMTFIALINNQKLDLDKKEVYINYNRNGEATKFCCVNDLVKCIDQDPIFSLLSTRGLSTSIFIGLLHILSGCDNL